jgi:hypothetical protein
MSTSIFFGSIKNTCFLHHDAGIPYSAQRPLNPDMSYQEMYGMKGGRTQSVLKKPDRSNASYQKDYGNTFMHQIYSNSPATKKRISDNLICYNGF